MSGIHPNRTTKSGYRCLKRLIDVVLSVTSLVVLSPLLAWLAVTVRLRLGSPVLFRQDRLGLDAGIFEMRKFRTMSNERDEEGELLPDAQRLSPFGARIRALSLDELPELVNVLRGEMSIVGPRPLHVRYLSRYSAAQIRRHEVRPGITGLAQISGRNVLTWEERFILDVEYVDTMNIGQDLAIIGRTLAVVARRDGINAKDHATMPEFMGLSE